MFLDQDYENKVMLIYNNSDVKLSLDESLLKEPIILINNHIDSKTGQPYTNLGAIYNDAIKYVPYNVHLLNGADDDDIFLPNHISEGVKGYLRGRFTNPNSKMYKPLFSYHVYLDQPAVKVANVMEPSMFVNIDHIKQYGYHENTENQHHKWIEALGKNCYVDEAGTPTMIYDWSQEIGTWKTSGDPTNPLNFTNYSNNSLDHGDGIITPWESCQKYYDLIKHLI